MKLIGTKVTQVIHTAPYGMRIYECTVQRIKLLQGNRFSSITKHFFGLSILLFRELRSLNIIVTSFKTFNAFMNYLNIYNLTFAYNMLE